MVLVPQRNSAIAKQPASVLLKSVQRLQPIERHDASDPAYLQTSNGDKPLNVMPSEYTLSDLRGSVNPNLQNISNFYEELNSNQVQHLDDAIYQFKQYNIY